MVMFYVNAKNPPATMTWSFKRSVILASHQHNAERHVHASVACLPGLVQSETAAQWWHTGRFWPLLFRSDLIWLWSDLICWSGTFSNVAGRCEWVLVCVYTRLDFSTLRWALGEGWRLYIINYISLSISFGIIRLHGKGKWGQQRMLVRVSLPV